MTEQELKQEFTTIWFGDLQPSEKEDAIKALDQLIADLEQNKWKKYPNEKPENGQSYDVTVKIAKADGGYIYVVKRDYYQLNGFIHNEDKVIAYRELPEPYKEGE